MLGGGHAQHAYALRRLPEWLTLGRNHLEYRRRSMHSAVAKPPTVAIASLGCKLNQSEAEGLARQFVQAGYSVVGPEQGADIFVLNTCTVTHVADRKSRQALRQARRANPDGLVVATGCYAQRSPEALKRMPEVSLVVDNADKTRLLGILGIDQGAPIDDSIRPPGRTRSMVKIQEGCNQVCAYCIVPRTRGRERSIPIDSLVQEVRDRVTAGYREVVLTGTQLGSYGYEFGPQPFSRPWHEELVRRILDETGVERLRMSSLQPQEITPGLMRLYAEGRLCPHVHMPLQSGSDAVLKRMRRRYTTALYAQVAQRLREAVPDISITADIIVGFPGETDEEFEEGYRFVEGLALAAAHVFPFSRRPGTTAAFLPDQVTPETRRAREERMLTLARETSRKHRRRFLGRRATVLWEQPRNIEGQSLWTGLTESYIRVYTRSHRHLADQILPVELTAEAHDGLWAALKGAEPLTPDLAPLSAAPLT